ncbi:DUF6680 family protein [Bordetella genomosp. 6]|uniref:DUF6680 family protein n=1 Tax=Bordetella genomosp. 6 TaxID=463024 RepID=UPI0012FCE624|nr:DUF6680 family protein [Bordetella genomosp. 6]
MNIDTWAVVFATLLGPVLAVQAQRIVAERGEARQRKQWLFRSLMNTRVGTLTAEHVNALNAVPLEFHKDKAIMRSWRTYLDHLNNQGTSLEAWGAKRVELYTDLLSKMAEKLNYGFDPLQLKNEIYAPRGHFDIENEQTEIRRGIVALMKGEQTLPLEVRSIAEDPETVKRTARLQTAMTKWLNGEIAPKVKVED